MMSMLSRVQLMLLLLQVMLASCSMNFSSSATDGCDSLYSHLTSLRFSDKDSLCVALDGIEGCQHLIKNSEAYVAMMDMDYMRARSLYDNVISSACNELDRLEAFIGMMRLCHRVSANREFYDYRAGAGRCMSRIEKELDFHHASLAEHFRMLRLDYNVISANYFASMGLYEDYSIAAKEVLRDVPLVGDTAMSLNAGLVAGSFRGNGLNERFSTLYRGKMRADFEGYRWLSGHYELMLSTLLRDRVVLDSLQRLSPGRIERLNSDSVQVEELPRLLAEKAVEDFAIYGDRYMVIKALAVLASCHTYSGDYLAALDVSAEALYRINDYYSEFYSDIDTLPLYELFQADDSVELKRMTLPNVVNIPECMLLIRNELSCAYAALGDKEASDVNRNSFLDLLHVTRQNSEIQSRIDSAARSAALMSRWVIALLAVLVVAVCVAVVLVRRWRKGNRRFTDSLMNMLQLCRELTAFPLSCEFADVEEVDEAIVSLLRSRLGAILSAFHGVDISAAESDSENVYGYSLADSATERLCVKCDAPLNGEERAIMELLVPYVRVARIEARRLVEMGDERLRLEEQNLACALTLAEHKRENVTKRASLSVANGIRPYLDRMANELNMLAAGSSSAVSDDERLAYMAELAEKISEYNTILERWIKMRHGELNLCIENFDVQELLDIIGKSSQAFAMKGLTLKVASDGAVVKADKALTLFMINTLADNAAKFTSPGGTVSIEAAGGDGFVEIAVSDTGVGLSDEDIHKILDAKVYDASTIGVAAAKNKGSGFGLMNCKGIIEKYKKTDTIFSVCRMDIKSVPGRGSRFSFRLPKGVLRLLLLIFTLVPSSLFATGHITALADSVYLSNVKGEYNRTLDYAAMALEELNDFYRSQGGSGDTLMLCGVGEAAEVGWWREGFAVDSLVDEVYYNLLDVRNEIAVALLALQRWDDYRYNNSAYTSLHRLVHEDKTLAAHYSDMRRVVNLRQATIAFSVALLLLLVAALLLYYFRHNFINRMNLYSALEVNRRLLRAVDGKRPDARQLVNIFAKELQESMSEIMRISAVRVAFVDAATGHTLLSASSSSLSGDERVEFSLEKSLATASLYTASDGTVTAFPLLVSLGDENRCIGAIAVETERRLSFNDRLTLELTARYMASVGYHSTVSMAQEYRSFDELVEESERMKFEENMLHVQNQVMDNCLSMIKHETIYYPSRIRELIGKFMQDAGNAEERTLRLAAMRELLEYYSSVYGVLTTCAGNQAGLNGFTPSRVAFGELAQECVSFVKRRARRAGLSLSLGLGNCSGTLLGDKELILFLLESLFEELIAVPVDGELRMSLVLGGQSALVEIVDCRRHLLQERMDAMFVPSSVNLSSDDEGLSGVGYLIAKEIVRMHEDYVGVYGGRIEAVDCADGTMIRFTLPC